MARAADRPQLYSFVGYRCRGALRQIEFHFFFFISAEIVIIESLFFHAKQLVISSSVSCGVSFHFMHPLFNKKIKL